MYRAAFGPANWPSSKAADTPKAVAAPASDLKVSNVRTSLDTLSFDVDKIGSPVLVKVSYFPNWEVTGADGPYRVTPNFMVVVPNRHHVKLSYGRTPMEDLSWLATAIGLVMLAGLVLWPRRAGADKEVFEFFGDRKPLDLEEFWESPAGAVPEADTDAGDAGGPDAGEADSGDVDPDAGDAAPPYAAPRGEVPEE